VPNELTHTSRRRNAQTRLFEPYAALLDHTPLWPTVGNHDVYNRQEPLPYQRVWTLPAAGEAGGAPSGTKFWYVIHVVTVQSAALGQYCELRADLG
jgi:hypothetical protein